MADSTEQFEELHKKLLANVKKEVKQIMEEAVTRKFVHEESSSITSLCGAVEVCLQQGLRRRALGLFKNSSDTQALLSKLSRAFEPAKIVSKALSEYESGKSNNRSLMQGRNQAASPVKYLWIRIALFEKQLAKIVSHLSENSSKYYEKDALMANPVDGPIVGSLLVGPCALDYTKMKTPDHYWTDPPADELVQRHRIHSNAVKPKHLSKQDSPKRPSLHVRRNTSSSSEESMRSVPLSAKDYVESLHQNSKSTLLYGKNNVFVQAKVENEKLPGYLSLHQSADGLCIKWTPNQLMNGCGTMAAANNTNGSHKENGNSTDDTERNNSVLWDYAVNIFVDDIVYLHCHQNPDTGGTIVLVGQDGVQRPPIHFPKGGHLLAFLSCLETGLLPNGRLDPPLWSQKGKGKVFPKIKRKASRNSPLPLSEDFQSQDDESTDYVFRIVSTSRPMYNTADLLETKPKLSHSTAFPFPPPPPNTRQHSEGKWWSISSDSPLSDSEVLQKQKEQQQQQHEEAVKQLCDTMKKQIISRAFYGWLAHCRHLKTVRTHLTGLVNPILVGQGGNEFLSKEKWERLAYLEGNGIPNDNIHDIHKLIYYGGCDHSIRKQVWPYLLEHYTPGSSQEERQERDKQMKDHYENVMSQWLAVEAIVRQRDKELMAASMAKLANPHINESLTLVRNDSSLSNDVFESVDDTEPSTGASKQSLLVECPKSDISADRPTSLGSSPPPLLPPANQTPHSTPTSPASNGGVYSGTMLENVALNWHRIDKDVQRCDRNYPYFSTSVNLDKLRNVMCTYVWEHLDVGYVQGMCDLVAPLLVVLDDEELTYSCFCELMKRMSANFPHGIAMDQHFANMRSLIQILDSELFDHMHHNGDYTHFYFCYRWFLLDFKRELVYEDVFSVWETIWAAAHVSSKHFVLFIALALVQTYRGIILDNNMDFTDIIKFFNEMAERHNAKEVLSVARDLVRKLHELIENK